MFEFLPKINLMSLGAYAGVLLLLCGCQPNPVRNAADNSPQPPSISNVPLRVWVVSPISDPEIIERQWLAGSEQPIELSTLSADDLLNGEACSCDAIVLPARNLGEVVKRGWIEKLPSAVLEQTSESETVPLASESAAAIAQTKLGSIQYAIPLACSVAAAIASPSLAESFSNGEATLDEVLDQLNISQTNISFSSDDVDKEAFVDRFLSVLSMCNDRNPTYGLLFAMQSMQPRFHEPEFARAVFVLKQLARQPGGAKAVVGSHDAAWRWAVENDKPVLAVAAPAMLDKDSNGLIVGKMLRIRRAATDSSVPVNRNIGTGPPSEGWNTGGGLIAAIATDCRQTSRASQFLRWLRRQQTRDAIAPFVKGVESSSPIHGANSSSWLTRRRQSEILMSSVMPREPCLPSAHALRNALADELLPAIQGEKSVEDALSAAAGRWREIIKDCGPEIQADYEQSLGLTL